MPALYRQVLDDVRARVTGLATTGTRVYESLAAALASSVLPALAVQPRSEDLVELFDALEGDLERRELSLVVVTVAATTAARDASALEVQAALMGSAIGTRRFYRGADFDERGEGERVLYSLSQRFAFQYHVVASSPGVIVE